MHPVAFLARLAPRFARFDPTLLLGHLALVAAVLVALWLGAYWLGRALAPPLPAVPALVVPETAAVAQSIVAHHLVDAPTERTPGAARGGAGGWRLIGLSAASTPTRGGSYALLQDGSGTVRAALAGGALAPGVVLRQVFADHVEIDRAGVVEAVHFDSSPHTGSPAVAAAAGIVAAGPATKDRR